MITSDQSVLVSANIFLAKIITAIERLMLPVVGKKIGTSKFFQFFPLAYYLVKSFTNGAKRCKDQSSMDSIGRGTSRTLYGLVLRCWRTNSAHRFIEVSPTLRFAFESRFDPIVPYVSSNTDLMIIYLATGARQINGTQ